MFVRRHGFCGVYSIVVIFVLSIACFFIALRSLREQRENVVGSFQKTNKTNKPTEDLMKFDKDMIYINKQDYKIAIGYQDNIMRFQDDFDLVSSVEEAPNQASIIASFENFPNNHDSSDGPKANTGPQNDDIESIDQNAVAEQYKDELLGKVRKFNCSAQTPLTNVVLLKTHRTGSTSIGNIFYRYGETKNLSFLLPSATTFNYYWPLRFHYSHTRLDLLSKEKANMAINIGRYSSKNIIPMMPNDTVVLTILRDPVRHFESVFEYAEVARLLGLLNTSNDPFSTFLDAPRNNVVVSVKESSSFAAELNLLKNGLSFDLGLEHQSYANEDDIKEFIKRLSEQIDLVLISEYIDESLIILKRMLCWEMDDILYVKHKVRNEMHRNEIKDKHKIAIQNWSKADVMLYDHFNKSLWNKIAKENETFFDELKAFRERLSDVISKCFEEGNKSRFFEKPVKLKKGLSQDLIQICGGMIHKDRDYVTIFKEKQQRKITTINSKYIDEKFYRKSNLTRVYYEYEISPLNSTVNNTRLYDTT